MNLFKKKKKERERVQISPCDKIDCLFYSPWSKYKEYIEEDRWNLMFSRPQGWQIFCMSCKYFKPFDIYTPT